MKPKFEVIPGNPKLQAIFEVNRLAKQEHLEVNDLSDKESEFRFQLWTENDGVALDKRQHEIFLDFLIEQDGIATQENAEVIVHSSGSINIIISF